MTNKYLNIINGSIFFIAFILLLLWIGIEPPILIKHVFLNYLFLSAIVTTIFFSIKYTRPSTFAASCFLIFSSSSLLIRIYFPYTGLAFLYFIPINILIGLLSWKALEKIMLSEHIYRQIISLIIYALTVFSFGLLYLPQDSKYSPIEKLKQGYEITFLPIQKLIKSLNNTYITIDSKKILPNSETKWLKDHRIEVGVYCDFRNYIELKVYCTIYEPNKRIYKGYFILPRKELEHSDLTNMIQRWDGENLFLNTGEKLVRSKRSKIK